MNPSNTKKLTAGEVIERFRQMPEMHELLLNTYYDDDILEAATRFYNSEEFQAVLALITKAGGSRPAGRVLDLGGGNGVASLAWHLTGYRSVLVEPDRHEIVGLGAIRPILDQGNYNITLNQAIGEALPFSDGSFDLVYCRQMLHHVSDLNRVCSEAYRVLKPDGIFLATREHVIHSADDLEIFLQNHPVHQYTGDENAFLLDEYRSAIQLAGFRDLQTLGTWQSVINYFPTTQQQFEERVHGKLRRYLGARISRRVSSWRVIQDLMGNYWSRREHKPGQMYSFLAVR